MVQTNRSLLILGLAVAAAQRQLFSDEDVRKCTRIRTPELVKTEHHFIVFANCCGKTACGHIDSPYNPIAEVENATLGDDHSTSRVIYISSKDEGKTWSKARFLADGKAGYGGVAAIWDSVVKSLVVQYDSKDGTKKYQVKSKDDGETWSKPRDLTDELKSGCPSGNLGETAGARVQTGTGRLLWYSGAGRCLWWSDDHGATYKSQRMANVMANEISFTRVGDGNTSYIFANGRGVDSDWKPHRIDYRSDNNGRTWNKSKSVLEDPKVTTVERSLLYSHSADMIFTAEPKGLKDLTNKQLGGGPDDGGHFQLVVSCAKGTKYSAWKFDKSINLNGKHYAGYSTLGYIPNKKSLIVVWDHEKDDIHTVGGSPLIQIIGTSWCS